MNPAKGLVESIDHLGWVVESLAEAQPRYERLYGLTEVARLNTAALEVVMLQTGSVTFELLAPVEPNSEFSRFLDHNGEGLHHIAYLVSDIGAAMQQAEARGMTLRDSVPRPGARNTSVAFAESGVDGAPIVQFVQPNPI